jgi:hypothetical protein
VDWYEDVEDFGRNGFTDLTFNLSVYPWENVRFYAEYAKTVDAPSGEDEPWRWTVQVKFGF